MHKIVDLICFLLFDFCYFVVVVVVDVIAAVVPC